MVCWMRRHQLCVGKPGSCEPARMRTQSLLVTLHFPHWQVWLLLTATNSSLACKWKARREHNIHNASTDYPSFQQDDNCLFIIATKKQHPPTPPHPTRMPSQKVVMENVMLFCMCYWIQIQASCTVLTLLLVRTAVVVVVWGGGGLTREDQPAPLQNWWTIKNLFHP